MKVSVLSLLKWTFALCVVASPLAAVRLPLTTETTLRLDVVGNARTRVQLEREGREDTTYLATGTVVDFSALNELSHPHFWQSNDDLLHLYLENEQKKVQTLLIFRTGQSIILPHVIPRPRSYLGSPVQWCLRQISGDTYMILSYRHDSSPGGGYTYLCRESDGDCVLLAEHSMAINGDRRVEPIVKAVKEEPFEIFFPHSRQFFKLDDFESDYLRDGNPAFPTADHQKGMSGMRAPASDVFPIDSILWHQLALTGTAPGHYYSLEKLTGLMRHAPTPELQREARAIFAQLMSDLEVARLIGSQPPFQVADFERAVQVKKSRLIPCAETLLTF